MVVCLHCALNSPDLTWDRLADCWNLCNFAITWYTHTRTVQLTCKLIRKDATPYDRAADHANASKVMLWFGVRNTAAESNIVRGTLVGHKYGGQSIIGTSVGEKPCSAYTSSAGCCIWMTIDRKPPKVASHTAIICDNEAWRHISQPDRVMQHNIPSAPHKCASD